MPLCGACKEKWCVVSTCTASANLQNQQRRAYLQMESATSTLCCDRNRHHDHIFLLAGVNGNVIHIEQMTTSSLGTC
jgi:hypothetical protein